MLNSIIQKKHQNFKNSTIIHDTKIEPPLNKLGRERNYINLTKNNYKVPIENITLNLRS